MMQKKIVHHTVTLSAVLALGIGSAFAAGPVAADPPQLTSQVAVKAAKQAEGINSVGFSNGTLYLGVESKSDATSADVRSLKEEFGADNVVVDTGVPELEAYAQNDLVGGMGYLMRSSRGTSVCSVGFTGTNTAGDSVALTAGHCAGGTTHLDAERPSTAPANGGTGFEQKGIGALGTWGYTKYATNSTSKRYSASDIDFAVVDVDESRYTNHSGITDWTTADSDDLSASTLPVTRIGAHANGTIQKSGRTTGLTTAQVMPRADYPYDFTKISGKWVHGFGVSSPAGNPFSLGGDSGGGVFQGQTAVGVISGGGPSTDANGNPIDFTWVADLDYSLEQSGVDFTLTP